MQNKFILHQREPPYGRTTVVSARLPDTLLRCLDHAAQSTGRTRNGLVVLCLEYAMATLEITKEAGTL